MTETEKKPKIRTRIAPSPTGSFHIGTARTALFNYVFAKKNRGKFILRIEDTDIERSQKTFEKDITDGLLWLEIKWDEGPHYQSERGKIYEKYLKEMIENGSAFWCPHTREELEKEREVELKSKVAQRHICEFREKNEKEGVLRFKNDEKEAVKFKDLIRGDIVFQPELLGDFSIAKSLNTPLYNFAVVVDDETMKISHVIRGEDHIPNTPKQILIQKALGFRMPEYAHLPLILGSDRSKLSKRHGAVSITEYRKMGYLARAVLNFIALLGWHPEDENEVFPIDRLIEEFSFKRVQKAGAVFDPKKLDWLNEKHIQGISTKELSGLADGFVPEDWKKRISENPEFWEKILELLKSRITKLSDIPVSADYFFEEPDYHKNILRWRGKENLEEVSRHLEKVLGIIEKIDDKDFKKENIKNKIFEYADKEGRGDVLWPLRVSLSGKEGSPDPIDILFVLGKKIAVPRIRRAIEKSKP